MEDRKRSLAVIGIVLLGIILLSAAVVLIVRRDYDGGQPASPGQLAEGALTALPTGRTFIETPTVTATSEEPDEEETAESGTVGGDASASGMEPTPTGTFNPHVTPMATHSGDEYDGHDTVYENLVTPDIPINGTIDLPFDAHNYYYEGVEDEEITITVIGDGITDPRTTIFTPNGAFLGENDDIAGGINSRLTVTLPEDGVYAIRITVWVVGPYTMTLTTDQ